MRNFDKWLLTLKSTIADWGYYTDFAKVYSRAALYRKELAKINKIIGSKNIKSDFKKIIEKDKNVMKAIPIIIANRNNKIVFTDEGRNIEYDFDKLNFTVSECLTLVEKSGILDLLQNHIINNLFDYVIGVEVGMDTNARKNRTGQIMENIVENHLKSLGFIPNKSMWSQMKASEIKSKFGIDLTNIDNVDKAEKVFDFVLQKKNKIFAIECNFYGSGGSKLNETARSYENIALQTKAIENFQFIWITDGIGWLTAKNNLKETFNILPTLFNLNDLQNNELLKVLK